VWGGLEMGIKAFHSDAVDSSLTDDVHVAVRLRTGVIYLRLCMLTVCLGLSLFRLYSKGFGH
jgi:hypothetical protein